MSDIHPPGSDAQNKPPHEDRHLAELERITPDEILRRIHAAGFTEASAALLHIVPLVQVAWADSVVTPRERSRVLQAAAMQGLAQNDPAFASLQQWLDVQPSDEFFHHALEAIRIVLMHSNADQRHKAEQSLLEYCSCIARASRGIFGLRRISDDEQAELELIAAELQRDNEAAVKAVLDKWRRIQDSSDLASFL